MSKPNLPEYSVWAFMRRRCTQPKDPQYKNYGGRGIRVCTRWSTFDNFLADLGRRPSAHHTIERIDNNGNYEPSNCRWATRAEQARNRRSVRSLTVDGVTRTLPEWRDICGISVTTLRARIDRGLTGAAVIDTSSVRLGAPPHNTTQGAACARAKLNDAQVREIRRQYAEGVNATVLGSAFGVTNVNISAIVKRKTWKHI